MGVRDRWEHPTFKVLPFAKQMASLELQEALVVKCTSIVAEVDNSY